MKTVLLPGIALLSAALSSCWYNHKWETLHPIKVNPNGCSDTAGITISYANDIAPILQNSCGLTNNSCHSASASGGDLTTYSMVSAWCNGSPSVLLDDINWKANNMPKASAKLSDCTIAKITKWVNQGRPNN